MTIKIRNASADDGETYFFQIYGPDTIDGTVRLAAASSVRQTPEEWLAASQTEAQALIDAGTGGSAFTIRQEAKIFLEANPNARLLIELGPAALEASIGSRNAAAETLLLKALSYAIRFLYATIGEDQ
jgi:hypothetical protein